MKMDEMNKMFEEAGFDVYRKWDGGLEGYMFTIHKDGNRMVAPYKYPAGKSSQVASAHQHAFVKRTIKKFNNEFGKLTYVNDAFASYCELDVMMTQGLYTITNKPKFIPGIKNVIFNNPATIVFWSDGSKTVVKCQDDDIYDPEKGLAMAISKKALGNQGNYCNDIKKWLPEEEDFEDRVAKGIGDLINEAFTTPKLGEYDPSPAKKALLALLRVQGKHNRALKKDYEEAVDEAYGYILEALED